MVIETVSARVTVPSGQVGQLYVSMSVGNLPNGTIAARHYIVLTPATDTTYFANEAFRMYGSVGVRVHPNAAYQIYIRGAGIAPIRGQFQRLFAAMMRPDRAAFTIV